MTNMTPDEISEHIAELAAIMFAQKQIHQTELDIALSEEVEKDIKADTEEENPALETDDE